jgi:hypothetical protein
MPSSAVLARTAKPRRVVALSAYVSSRPASPPLRPRPAGGKATAQAARDTTRAPTPSTRTPSQRFAASQFSLAYAYGYQWG